jgi:catechol 2,3-dioxygenase-like lactoylglutathione lyase family enzyme
MRELIDRLLGGYEKGSISRRDLVLGLSALFVGSRATSAAAAPASAEVQVQGINHVTMFVSDMDRSVAFYQKLFGLEVQSVQSNGTNLGIGPDNQFLGLFQIPNTAPRIDHVCLSVNGFDAESVLAALREEGVEGRVRMRGEVPELYFADPDGLSVQLQDVSYCGGSGALGEQC